MKGVLGRFLGVLGPSWASLGPVCPFWGLRCSETVTRETARSPRRRFRDAGSRSLSDSSGMKGE
eukprot:8777497-Pyramimonas_sp.AAC.1